MSAHDHDNGVSKLRAEVAQVAERASGADARATEALHRVRVVREALDETHQDLGGAISATQADLLAVEVRLSERIEALERTSSERHEATVGHLSRLWEVAVVLRDRQPADRTAVWSLFVVAALALQSCPGAS